MPSALCLRALCLRPCCLRAFRLVPSALCLRAFSLCLPPSALAFSFPFPFSLSLPSAFAAFSRMRRSCSRNSGVSSAPKSSFFNRRRKPKSLTTENPDGRRSSWPSTRPRPTRPARRLEDRRAGPRGARHLRRHSRLLPGHGPDARLRGGLPGGEDPLSGRRRRLVLRAAGGQGRPGVPEPAGQSEG